MQSRLQSFIESCLDTGSGVLIAYLAGLLIYPFMGMHVSARDNLILVLFFTAISIGRKYLWRRLFNHLGTRK